MSRPDYIGYYNDCFWGLVLLIKIRKFYFGNWEYGISIFIWIGIRDCVSGLEILTKDWDFGVGFGYLWLGLEYGLVIGIGDLDWGLGL